MLDRIYDNSGDKTHIEKLIVNNAGKVESTLSRMEQWSILSNVINYVHYSKNPKNFHAMSIKLINKNKINAGRRQEDKDRFSTQVSLKDTSDTLREE